MGKKLAGKDLIEIGYKKGPAIGMLLKLVHQHFSGVAASELRRLLKKLKNYPELFLDDPVLQPVAKMIAPAASNPAAGIELNIQPSGYKVYGSEYIEAGALQQMNTAMKLPVSLAGALMPDAHQGYGLPIGGVLATRNAIIPYGVGVDIGCRMALSILDIPEKLFSEKQDHFKQALLSNTRFGAGKEFNGTDRADHQVLESSAFREIPMLKPLQAKAAAQLGTSGGGNHFVEFGIIEFKKEDSELGLSAGRYIALLSHSGSRGMGAAIANHYTKLAKSLCKLPKEALNLAYLDLASQEGQEYWIAMNLAGDYASACHEVIHNKVLQEIGASVIARIENHHNFAWKETLDGEDVLVHRKGATPAGKNVLGVIPGSMTAPGFLVRGKGNTVSLNSASHGAGRQMSRTKALQSISRDTMRGILRDHNVTLIGGGLDEAPMAYKDIHQVMAAQTELVDVLATFEPRIVRMADDGSRED